MRICLCSGPPCKLSGASARERMGNEPIENLRLQHCHKILGVVWLHETLVLKAMIEKVQDSPTLKNVNEVKALIGT